MLATAGLHNSHPIAPGTPIRSIVSRNSLSFLILITWNSSCRLILKWGQILQLSASSVTGSHYALVHHCVTRFLHFRLVDRRDERYTATTA